MGETNINSRTLLIEYVAVGALRTHPKNPRIHSDKQLGQLADRIRSLSTHPRRAEALSQARLRKTHACRCSARTCSRTCSEP
jgi:hypothetical protein